MPLTNPDGSSTGSSSPADAVAYTPNADLARVVELWPHIPPAIRAAIVTLANTSAPALAKGQKAPADNEDRDVLPPGYERQAGK